MALKIRLRRMGATKQPAYRVVVAESRFPRDGNFVETIGHYNPLTQPATVHINLERVEYWQARGAKPTETVSRLLKGVTPAVTGVSPTDEPTQVETLE